jgi:polysaccharide export outer membrane protein
MTRIYNAIVLLCLLVAASCSSPKKTIYFNESSKSDTTVVIQTIQPHPEIIIQPDDILAINVSSIQAYSEKDPVSIFNGGGTQYNITPTASGTGGNSGSANVNGFLVDKEGNIDFPVLGRVKVAGLTIRQIKDLMIQKLTAYLKDPVVEARIINFKITMLGEVGRVGPVLAQTPRMNILDAISAAGDIPITGRKDNVLIIRENGSVRSFAHVNLNSKDLFTSPFFYLQQNDIVYVEPSRIRRQESNQFLRFYLPTISNLLSTALAVYGIVQLTK